MAGDEEGATHLWVVPQLVLEPLWLNDGSDLGTGTRAKALAGPISEAGARGSDGPVSSSGEASREDPGLGLQLDRALKLAPTLALKLELLL